MAKLTTSYDDALLLASELHRNQYRKGSDVPYLSHLLRVSGTALECGADEKTAIAALLHDAVEDQGGLATAARIREKFGDQVCDIVLECSDSYEPQNEKKRPWKERKDRYIEHLKTASPEACLISACDKLDNLTSTFRGFRQFGIKHFERFSGAAQGASEKDRARRARANLRWYYRSILDILKQRQIHIVEEMENLFFEIFDKEKELSE